MVPQVVWHTRELNMSVAAMSQVNLLVSLPLCVKTQCFNVVLSTCCSRNKTLPLPFCDNFSKRRSVFQTRCI